MDKKPVPHVLIFPFPAQGHVNSMLKLAELLCLAGLRITFINTDHYHHRLLRYTDAQARFASFPLFRFETISDGLPDDHPRTVSALNDIVDGMNTVGKQSFQELLISIRFESVDRPPVTCIISDGLMPFPVDVAKEAGIPSISFRTGSACYLWACYHFPKLVEAGEVPFPDDDMDKLMTFIPGMETFLRRRDLPSFYRAKDPTNPLSELSWTATLNSTRASATLLNTFEELEGPILSKMAHHFPKIYAIGPLHAHLSSRQPVSSSPSSSSNSLWEVDRNCMTWLDSQPLKSVVYVSFGSLVLMTHTQMLEFWHGLVNSGKRFLWVIRPESVTGRDEIPTELTEGKRDRGYMLEWSPQEEVLVHPAVGGFLTHSGWNSTLESIIAGVPMLCWPYFADQQINSRFVSEVWRVGLDMKDTCDRSTVEKMVNDLMDFKRDELMKSLGKITKTARMSVSEGGTSYCNLETLIEDIKSMKLKA